VEGREVNFARIRRAGSLRGGDLSGRVPSARPRTAVYHYGAVDNVLEAVRRGMTVFDRPGGAAGGTGDGAGAALICW